MKKALKLLAMSVLALGMASAGAQNYPVKPIRMIVPFPPGPTDAGARILADAMSTRLGKTVVVENMPGANGSIGAEMVVRAQPDGYTLLFTPMGTLVMNPHLYRPARVLPERDLVPVAKVFDTPLVIEARPDRNIKSLEELIARARSAPGKLSYASGGTGSSTHMAAELFQFHTKTRLLHIPYKGNSPALQDLLSGQVDVMFDQLASSLPHIRANKLHAVAVTAPERLAALPDVPTVVELGYPSLLMSSWASVTAPIGTPKEIVDLLSRTIVSVLQEPAVRQRMERNGAVSAPGDSEALASLLKEETERWGKVIRAANISGNQ